MTMKACAIRKDEKYHKNLNNMTDQITPSQDWIDDCLYWHGKILIGKKAHWCTEWDDLPIDETCSEFEFCTCDLSEIDQQNGQHVQDVRVKK